MKAIIFTSNTGTTEQYARMLGEETGLPVYAMKQADAVTAGSEIIYFGWVMAGGIKGYKKAAKRFHIKAACGVCMGATGSQLNDIRQRNKLPDEIKLFTLQGGYNKNDLHGLYKFMMKTVERTAGKALAKKKDRTPEEEQMYEMLQYGGNHVSKENLQEVLQWYEEQK